MDIATTTSGATMTGSSTQGIKTVLHPRVRPGGGRLVAIVSDPDGNVLGLLQVR
jgi:predicted enzyme related to lactoylglutathione lyase